MKKKLLSLIMALSLCLQMLPTVFAEGADGLCPHHTVHDEYCGYVEATGGSPCTHVHDESCYIELPMLPCAHVHDDECGYDAETGSDCTHICSVETGCLTLELVCEHEHNDFCGYVEATEGRPCEYYCELCDKAAAEQIEAEQVEAEPETEVEPETETKREDAENIENTEESKSTSPDDSTASDPISELPPYVHDPSIQILDNEYEKNIRSNSVINSTSRRFMARYAALPSDTPCATSIEEAAEIFRKAFTTDMKLTHTIALDIGAQVNNIFIEDLWSLIFKDTGGNPIQGDYLRYSVSSTGAAWSVDTLNDKQVQRLELSIQRLLSLDNPDMTVAREAYVSTEVGKIAQNYVGKTDYEIIKAVHDEICTTVKYDTHGATTDPDETHDGTPWTAYKALKDKTCVCQGYATLYYRILRELGVEVRCMTSSTHMWNIVKLDGLWYVVDTTWDEVATQGLDQAKTDWLLKGSHCLTGQHYPDKEYKTTEFKDAYPLSSTDYKHYDKPVPELISAISASGGIELKWKSVEGVTRYKLLYKAASDSTWKSSINVTATSYTLTNLTPGTKYFFTVCCIDSTGNEISKYDPVGLSATLTLETPELVSATSANNGIRVSWNKVPKASRYKILYKLSSDSTWTDGPITSSTSYTVTGLTLDETYSFTVCCVDSAGNEISDHDTTGKTAKYEGFSIPELVSANAVSNGIRVTWRSVSGATRYKLFYKEATETSWAEASTTSSTSYTVTGLKPMTEYFFTVCCADSAGNVTGKHDPTGLSASFALPTPVLRALTSVVNGVSVRWDAVSAAAKYEILYKESTEATWSSAGSVSSTSYTVTGLTLGTEYSFTVRCLDSTDAPASELAVEKSVLFEGVPKLSTPELVSASAVSNGIRVTWRYVNGATKYKLLYKESTAYTWTDGPTTSSTSYTMTGMKPGVTYSFTVCCVDSAGNATSDYDTTGLNASFLLPTPVISSIASISSGVALNWNTVAGATKYEILYKAEADSAWLSAGSTLFTNHVVTGLTLNTTYSFKLKCIDASGNPESKDSAVKTIKFVGTPKLSTPVLSSLTEVSNGITVKWNSVTGATGYEVLYRKSTDSTWSSAGYATGTSFTLISGLSLNTTYSFTVRCVTSSGEAASDLATSKSISYKGTQKLVEGKDYTAPKANSIVYDGKEHELTTKGTCSKTGLNVYFAFVDSSNKEIPSSKSSLPLKAKEAGTYKLGWFITDPTGKYEPVKKLFTVTISKPAPVDTVPLPNCPTGVTQAFVDGKAVTITDGRIPATAANAKVVSLFTYSDGDKPYSSDKNNRSYPKSMKAWTLSTKGGVTTATRQPKLDNILAYNGTSVRVPNYGVRVISSIPIELKTQGIDGFTLIEYGTEAKGANGSVMAPAYKKGGMNTELKREAGRIQFTNALVNFPTGDDCRKELNLRGYVKLSKDGEEFTIYGGWINRSIVYVAKQNVNAFPKGSQYDKFIQGIIAYDK